MIPNCLFGLVRASWKWESERKGGLGFMQYLGAKINEPVGRKALSQATFVLVDSVGTLCFSIYKQSLHKLKISVVKNLTRKEKR